MRLKILIAGIEPPDDVQSWSGTPYHLSEALRSRFDIAFVGGIRGPRSFWHRVIAKIYRWLRMRSYRVRSEPQVLDEFGRRLRRSIERENPDAILSIGCEPIARHESNVPAFLMHDATFRQLVVGYPHFRNLCKRSRMSGERAERDGFRRATAVLSASTWAKESACNDYGINPNAVHVLPMGANFVAAPLASAVTAAIEKRVETKSVNFLFIGVEWKRKGGDAAVRIVKSLVDGGLDAKLHVVGCVPPQEDRNKSFVISHGFLSKKVPADTASLEKLFWDATFFIMPSLAECYGCVFCEASAFGLPSIARAVGGVPDIIKHGKTGLLLSDELSEERLIADLLVILNETDRYREMARSARQDYEERLTWEAYAPRLEQIIRPFLLPGIDRP